MVFIDLSQYKNNHGVKIMPFKELEDLTDAEKSVLLMSYTTLNKSIGCHQPKQRVFKKIVNMKHRVKDKAFKTLISNQFLRKHPTGRNTTYQLTPKGKAAAEKHIKENFNEI